MFKSRSHRFAVTGSANILAVAALLMGPSVGHGASFTPLGLLPVRNDGYLVQSNASAVSADGAVVVGSSGGYAFRWTEATGIQALSEVAGSQQPVATGVSADGRIIVGNVVVTSNYINYFAKAFRWTDETGMVTLDDLPAAIPDSHAAGISADGSLIVGTSRSGTGTQGYRWTAINGTEAFGAVRTATAVSAAGDVVVGQRLFGSDSLAYRWTAAAGFVALGDLPGGGVDSGATAVSADGSVVVGQSRSAGAGFDQAFRWTGAGGMLGLGFLAPNIQGPTSEALGVSGDGGIVVGQSRVPFGPGSFDNEAFLWTSATGMVRLFDVLVANGATGLDGWQLSSARAISADGQWVVGYGRDPQGVMQAFRANLTPVPLPAAVWCLGAGLVTLGSMIRQRQCS